MTNIHDTYQQAADGLWSLIEKTILDDDPASIETIRGYFGGEPWTTVVEKAQAEGSIWYSWWMDGVRQYIEHLSRQAAQPSTTAIGDNLDVKVTWIPRANHYKVSLIIGRRIFFSFPNDEIYRSREGIANPEIVAANIKMELLDRLTGKVRL